MSETTQDTTLNSITDNLAESFFEGGASSANVVTAAGSEPSEGAPEGEKAVKLNTFVAEDNFKAEDLLGDLLENETKVVDQLKKTEVTSEPVKTTQESDFNFMIEDGLLAGFEDDTPIKSKDDLAKLIAANKEYWVTEAKAKAIEDEHSTLPDEVKFVLEYAKKGGDDLKTVFKLLAQAEEARSYDVTKVEDQKAVIRDYYESLGWTEEETEDELLSLNESKRLQAAAEKFKPKLDSIKKQELEERAAVQNQIEEQRSKARQFFESNVVNTLKGGKVGELKLSKDEQKDLYEALIKEQYQSFNGPTNRLGALLDRIQYVKPDYEHLMEVAMLLSNREGFKRKIKEQITTEVSAEQVKKIKTEQQKQKIGSSHNPEKETKRLPKLGQGFINPF